MDQEEKKNDSKLDEYIIQRVAGLFGVKKNIDKFKKSFEADDNKRSMDLFLSDDDYAGHLFITPTGDTVAVSQTCQASAQIRKKILLVYKTVRRVPITNKNIRDVVGFMELSKAVLENMSLKCQEVFLPILANPQNQQGWSDLVSKDLIENKFHNFLSTIYVTIGEVKGRTMLPIPPQETTTSDRISSKDKAHVLEGAVITWSKQIKNVLKQDPESALKQGNNPGPIVEINFWKNKAENLNSIHDQIQSEKISKVLKFLEQNKSTYTNQFAKLKKDVKAARMEANDNYNFLSSLSELFNELTDEGREFVQIEPLFVPIMHTILLIWENSQYYNIPARLVVLIREICNAIIQQACKYLSGKDIFDMISDEQAATACDRLGTILDVIAKFKESFFEYKARAKESWSITTNALFVRLDAFAERCQDIQHLTNTIVQFSKLEKIEIGGTKGKTLTTSVKQIFKEFQTAVEEFQKVTYDIMDVSAKAFDVDFYEFRSKIKELERRLGSILTQGFDDSDTIYGRFKLLESFEGLLTRPIIQDELEKKHITLLETYKHDLKNVQQIFLENKALIDRLDPRAPISKNMPPVTGAINWTRGLMERIKEPMEKLSALNQSVLEREEYKDVQKLYGSIVKSLGEYQNIKIDEWKKEVDEKCKDKLKLPLLARDESDFLKVNFDPALVKLLREVKYFKLIDLPVPESAEEIFTKSEIFRRQTANLDMIVFLYNEIKETLLPVERPLLEERIVKMDEILEPGLTTWKWRSPKIDDFIHDAMIVVKDVSTTVKAMQKHLVSIKGILEKWAEKPLLDRKSKPMSPDDFDQANRAVVAHRQGEIIAGGKDINKFMKDTGECVKNARKTPNWLSYQDFVNSIIIEGLSNVIFKSVNYMGDLFDSVLIKKLDQMPMFDIRIELLDNEVIYTPEIESNERGSGLHDLVNGWISDFMKITTLFSRIDGASGDYLFEVKGDFDVQYSLSKIDNHLRHIEEDTSKFKSGFMEYSYLWEEDLNKNFQDFLEQGELDKKGGLDEDEEEEKQRLEKLKSHPIFEGVSVRIPELSLFNEKITHLKAIQAKIANVNTPHDIAWIRIHVDPLKIALNNRVSKWITVYTGFLLKNVTGSMKNLTNFIEVVGNGTAIQEDDSIPQDLLMKIMSHVRDVRTISDICDNMFVPMREQVVLLKKHGVNMEGELITKIEDLKTKWEDLKLKVNNVKAIILPRQTDETKIIKAKLKEFDNKVADYREDFVKKAPFNFEELTDEFITSSYNTVDTVYTSLCTMEEEARHNNDLNELFELAKSNYRPLKECRQELCYLKSLWDAISLVHNQYSDWKTTLWDKIDTEDLLEQNKNLMNMVKNLPKEIKTWKGFFTLNDTVKNMAVILPLINELHSPSMEPRHWRQLMQISKKNINHTSPTFCLDDLLHMKLHEFDEDVREIVAQSQREATIEKKLNGIENAWTDCVLTFETHKDCPLILPLDDTIEMLEQHSMELMSMQGAGKSVEYFKDRVNHWLGALKTVESVLGVWIKVQRNWRRLETIFLASEDIRSQLPDQTKLFEQIDNEFRDIMNDAKENCSIIEATTLEGREEALDSIHQNIDSCERALNEYLAQKKKQFPRFYFISNQALLDILSNGNNPHKVCEYLGDLFNGMRAIEFLSEGDKLTNISIGMYSKEESEYVEFPEKTRGGRFVCEGAVENWLSDFEVMMQQVLKAILEVARVTAEMWDIQGEKPRETWIDDYPAQIALVGTQIVWTEEVARTIEEVFVGSESAMKEYFKISNDRINKLIDRVVDPVITKDLRAKIITIITIDVHGRDVVDKFAVDKIADTNAFAWQKQLKFEWKGATENDPNKDCAISICDYRSLYTYEYVGNCGRLVITPLTDRCYITLTQALNLIMGGAPAGPAGTGKTETVKDLGRACGLPVIVFNCSPQMNKESMGLIFLGLAQTGSWGCFDEFNRINIEVLSVVATQVKTILDAKRANKTRFQFEEEDNIVLKYNVGLFITMNPGYAGRTELPENIKALFRSCAMVVPDTMLICENMLMSEGFKNAKLLSHKFVTLYGLSKDLLSKQKHYDWGLRAVKSVLKMAGKLRREDPEMDEDPVLMRALRDFNLPKIVSDDKPIFLTLIRDLFPGLDPEPKFNAALKDSVIAVTKKAKLQAEEIFVNKCIQLLEIMEVRHSVFVIGPPGAGKTEVWRMLAAVEGPATIYETINPKAVTAHELFGYLTKTKEWKDGVLSVVMRDMCKNQNQYKPSHKNKWIVLDGDIDPNWIESLNTVMDDNKVLTLVSNERIPLTSMMRLIFEISHLKNATPATVSRAGVLFINDIDIGTKPFVDSWLENIKDDIARSYFMLAYQQIIENNMEEIHKFTPIVPTVDIAMVQALCCILQSLINSKDFKEVSKNLKEEDKKMIIEAYFLYAGIWAIGGAIGDDRLQAQFNGWWRHIGKKFPENGTVYDYFFDTKTLNWVPWSERLNEYIPMGETNVNNIIVPTVDIIRLKAVVALNVEGRRPSMFIGGSGTGKTTVVKDYMSQLNNEEVLNATINFNNYTDSLLLQRFIEGNVEKRMGREYGPPANKILIFFIDDLNMPAVDQFGTQSPISLLNQLINYHQMYDRDHLEEQKRLKDCLFMASMNPKSGCFTVDVRCQRQFTTFACLLPGVEILSYIYTSILHGHMAQFDNSISKLCDKFVASTIELFKLITENPEFSPSARKFHYQFNLRDISRIMGGVMQSQPNLYRGQADKFIRLWVHECDRTYLDRLITEKDVDLYRDFMTRSSKKFEEDCSEIFVEPNIYTSFAAGDKAYLPIKDMEQLKKILEEKLEEYNENNAQMNLVLFDIAMEHVCRISRIIDMPAGNALLVGVGGSGKQSLSRLASFILGYDIVQILVSDKYTINEFKADIQEFYKKAGVKAGGTNLVFLITDTQIQDERFLIYINDLLSSGYVQDLFEKDDLDAIFSSLRNEAKGVGVLVDSQDAMMEYFIDKTRKNLHIVLCFSPVGDLFRVRARKFPGLISCTLVDWFHEWPRDALVDVGSEFLKEIEVDEEETRLAMANYMADVHVSVNESNKVFLKRERRFNYTTPKSFLELIEFFKKLLSKKRGALDDSINRLVTGLEILAQTKGRVENLKQDLDTKMIEVKEKQEDTNKLIVKVKGAKEIADKEMEEAGKEEAVATALTEAANELKAQAEKELEEAEPAMLRAKEAVNCLTKQSLQELKALPKPPPAVLDVTKAVLLLKGERKNFSWQAGLKMLVNPPKFLEELYEFDKENIDDWILEQLKPIILLQHFTQEEMKSKSEAASFLCAWVVNIVEFNRIFKKVKPLMEKKAEAEREAAQKEEELSGARAKVKAATDTVEGLEEELNSAVTLKERVEGEAEEFAQKLELARRLVNGLGDENTRWSANVAQFRHEMVTVLGDALLAAAFVSYIGPFSAWLRLSLWSTIWLPNIHERKIKYTDGVDPMRVLCTESHEAKWRNFGLPADRMSTENAAIFKRTSRWPLIIDPQLQGSKWIRGMYGEELEVIQFSQDRWVKRLETCIQIGKTVLIENIAQDLDAILEPLLARAIIKKGRSTLLIKLGSEEIEYNPAFKLTLQTKLSNPHYRPEIAAQCTIINFIVTESGLEDQLLATVVNIEKPELESSKQELVKKQNEFKVILANLERDLLKNLSGADPNTILSNTELIEGLESTKTYSKEIQEQTIAAQKTEVQINQAREVYRKVAAEGAMLYFLIISLCIIDHMYQYSLESFLNFFLKAIDRTGEFDEVEQRVLTLRDNIRMTIFQWVSRGLFEKHKQIFLTQITLRLMQKNVVDTPYDPQLVGFLLKGPLKPNVEKPQTLDWLPDISWAAVQRLIEIEEFQNFATNMEKDAPTRFKEWFNDLTPESAKLPLDWKRLDNTPFQKLLVLRCLRPDRLTTAVSEWIREAIPNGPAYVDIDQGMSFGDILKAVLEDSSNVTPIFFILSPGTDPVAEVEKIGKTRGIEEGKNYWNVAMGQGQEGWAMRCLDMGHKEGHWVILQNIHLMPKWLLILEKKLDFFASEGSNMNFRLFLSAEPSPEIPIGILDRSIKLTNEPPQGMKANIKRALAQFNKEEFNERDLRIRSIIFGLCFFHATVVERKKFGAKGWNMSYPFSAGDLRDSSLVLLNYFENNQGSTKIPWEDLRYIFGEIMYGGHIVDDLDRRLCMTYLSNLMDNPLLDEVELFPFNDGRTASFRSPTPMEHQKYLEYIDETYPGETPIAFGMHPNAEIGFRTAQGTFLFTTLLELAPRDESSVDDSNSKTKNEVAQEIVTHILEDLSLDSMKFDLADIKGKVPEDEDKMCFINVFMQECEYMNYLLIEMLRSLLEINLALNGELTATEKMEQTIDSLVLERVPTSWSDLAYPSCRGLSSWLVNLQARVEQLSTWKDEPTNIPKITNISRLFNPQSFLTAVQQYYAQKTMSELNKLYIQTEVTKKFENEIEDPPRDGSFVTGLFLDGARWDVTNSIVEESRPKEMFSPLPVVNCKAALKPTDGKEDKSIYLCPVYKTENRGSTFVFQSQLRTPKYPAMKWTLAGVAVIMDVEGMGDPVKK